MVVYHRNTQIWEKNESCVTYIYSARALKLGGVVHKLNPFWNGVGGSQVLFDVHSKQ